MDNKQDRQFYWEVKNFLGRNTNSLPKTEVKKTSLKESIGNVLKSTDYLYTPKNNSQEIYEEFVSSIDNRMVKSVNTLLDQHKKVLDVASPDLAGHYENITENLFTLNKKKLLTELVAQDLSSVYAQAQAQLAQQLAQNKKTSKKDEEEEEEDQAVSSPIMQAPATQAPESLAAAPTAAPATPSSSLAAPSTGTAPGPSRVAALSMRGIDVEPGDKDILVDLRKARGMPKGDRGGRTPEERASNRAEREERNARLLAANIATRGERERLQDQAAEARKQRDDLKKSISVEVEGPPAPGGAQPTAIESQSDKAKDYAASVDVARQAQEQLRKFNDRSGYYRPRTEYGNITQATIGARYATKPGKVVAMADQMNQDYAAQNTDLAKRKAEMDMVRPGVEAGERARAQQRAQQRAQSDADFAQGVQTQVEKQFDQAVTARNRKLTSEIEQEELMARVMQDVSDYDAEQARKKAAKEADNRDENIVRREYGMNPVSDKELQQRADDRAAYIEAKSGLRGPRGIPGKGEDPGTYAEFRRELGRQRSGYEPRGTVSTPGVNTGIVGPKEPESVMYVTPGKDGNNTTRAGTPLRPETSEQETLRTKIDRQLNRLRGQ